VKELEAARDEWRSVDGNVCHLGWILLRRFLRRRWRAGVYCALRIRGARGTEKCPVKREKSSLKEVAITGGKLGPWALNQIGQGSSGQSALLGALKDLNFMNGIRPGRKLGKCF
jgi:hypothetical protein